MKLGVIGSRDFNDYDLLKLKLDNITDLTEIVSGGATGADKLAEFYGNVNGIKTTIFIPDWSKGKSAGFTRNTKIVEYSDQILAFWDGHSRGTLDSINKAKKLKKNVGIIMYKNIDNIFETFQFD